MIRLVLFMGMAVCSYAHVEAQATAMHWQDAIVTRVDAVADAKSNNYFPALSHDETTLLFISDRKAVWTDSASGRTITDQSHNIWYTSKQPNGLFGAPRYFFVLNSPYNEGALCSNADGSQYLFVSCDREGLVIGSCDILVLRSVVDSTGSKKWEVHNVGPNVNTREWESSPALAPDGTLFFTSSRTGGYGGLDIWYSPYNWETQAWEPAQNAGPTINTARDELGCFVSADGTMLLFSSNGHASCYGAEDFYVSFFAEDGTLSVPQNLGEPLNSTSSDVGIVLTQDHREAYFSSKRDGKVQIYKAVLPVQEK